MLVSALHCNVGTLNLRITMARITLRTTSRTTSGSHAYAVACSRAMAAAARREGHSQGTA